MSEPDVIVVGGGIGGLSAALALGREGLRVRVLERAEEFSEVGAGLQIAPNCTRILDEYGLLDAARQLGVVPEDMIMFDAIDGGELTRLDLRDLRQRYGSPYVVMHRSDLHGLLMAACQVARVELLTGQQVVDYDSPAGATTASVILADGRVEAAPMVVAAEGLHSVARAKFVGDEPVSSSYVAYRGTVPIDQAHGIHEKSVVVYIGEGCHFVQYALRGGEVLNQVAVFESPKAKAGDYDWGTPDELDAAFEGTVPQVRESIPLMWRDRWWRMFDREPISQWVHGRVALLGDAAHPPLQYLAQGAVMAIEDGWVLAKHVARQLSADRSVDWDAALAAYQAVRSQHCRRVLTTAREWGELWHLRGLARTRRNVLLRARDTYDYSFVDWIYGPTALFPEDEAEMFTRIPLDSVPVADMGESASRNR